jgi:hypothetical protein
MRRKNKRESMRRHAIGEKIREKIAENYPRERQRGKYERVYNVGRLCCKH